MMFLPPTIALKSSSFNTYLNYSNDSDSERFGYLRVNETNIFSPLVKFEVVAANTVAGLVHIRCSHNRKFLRLREPVGLTFNVSPDADEPEEDQSNIYSCTLFEPRAVENGNPDKIRLFHVSLNNSRLLLAASTYVGDQRFFIMHQTPPNNNDILDVIDLESSLVMLPRHVAFKSHTGDYLKLVGGANLRFISTDKGISESWFVVSTDSHARIQIKSFHDNGFFYNSRDSILSSPTLAGTNPSTFFWPVRLGGNTVALRSMSNDKYCAHISDANGTDLNAAYTTITDNSRFTLEELVLSRRIYNAEFDLKNAIIYGETPVTMATANARNNTSADNTVEFKFAYTESKSSTWTSSSSWLVGVSVSVSFRVPFIGGTDVTTETEFSGSYEWGETVTTENTLETTYTVTVPANTSISVSLMATKGNCDVPYSYYQRDLLYNGKTVVYMKNDGLYTGINSYNFRYEVTTLEEPASRAALSTKAEMLPDPSVDPTVEEVLPLRMPVSSGSTTMGQNKVSSTTTTPEKELLSLKLEDSSLSEQKIDCCGLVGSKPDGIVQ
ncbi:uncharacterized protein LOC126797356 [Argentina anserina]|uniref:uncharacterized protein LOC126797356 n=1 Tax=Argentina anserina TaxID=57926 RepID=UPI0021766B67|nr:uncharacterized protein LOC126797356 [Potentilla anserina]